MTTRLLKRYKKHEGPTSLLVIKSFIELYGYSVTPFVSFRNPGRGDNKKKYFDRETDAYVFSSGLTPHGLKEIVMYCGPIGETITRRRLTEYAVAAEKLLNSICQDFTKCYLADGDVLKDELGREFSVTNVTAHDKNLIKEFHTLANNRLYPEGYGLITIFPRERMKDENIVCKASSARLPCEVSG